MSTPNNALNILAKIITNAEKAILSQANYINVLQEFYQSNSIISKIEFEQNRLMEWIQVHETLEQQFSELLTYLENQENYVNKTNSNVAKVVFRYQHLEAINKDAIYWKNKADYYQKTRSLIFNQLTKLQDGQKDKFN
jgi:hypothetical protein